MNPAACVLNRTVRTCTELVPGTWPLQVALWERAGAQVFLLFSSHCESSVWAGCPELPSQTVLDLACCISALGPGTFSCRKEALGRRKAWAEQAEQCWHNCWVVFALSGAREYHVQFFSNQPERAWVHEKRVREYQGHKQYEQLLAEAAKQASNHSEKQKVQGALGDHLCKGDAPGQVWNSAVLCPEKDWLHLTGREFSVHIQCQKYPVNGEQTAVCCLRDAETLRVVFMSCSGKIFSVTNCLSRPLRFASHGRRGSERSGTLALPTLRRHWKWPGKRG